MNVSGMLRSTCDIQTKTVTKDGIAGVVESYANRLQGVPCRIRKLSGNEVAALGTDREVGTHRVYLQPSEALGAPTNKDRIISSKGKILDVVYPDNTDEQDELWQIDCVERK
jgi:head-tail adaptor